MPSTVKTLILITTLCTGWALLASAQPAPEAAPWGMPTLAGSIATAPGPLVIHPFMTLATALAAGARAAIATGAAFAQPE